MLVRDVMTTKIISVSPKATIAQAIDLMVRHRISGLPVIDGTGALVGMVSEGDFLRRVEIGTQKPKPRWLVAFLYPGKQAETYAETHGRHIDEVMTEDVQTIPETASLQDAVAAMESHDIKRLPVLRDGRPIGIVTRADIVHALMGYVGAGPVAPAVSDALIRTRILDELDRQDWAPVASIRIEVEQGVVHLHGALTDERQRTAVRVAAENVEGVREVHDHLIWVEPYSGMALESPEDRAAEEAVRRQK